MSLLIATPIIVPLSTAVLCFAARRSRAAQRFVSVAGAAALLGFALTLFVRVEQGGVLASQMGAWPAPWGITLVADLLSATLVALTAIVGLAVVVYSLAAIDQRRDASGYHPLLHTLLMGVSGAFLTGDLFNMYVWFEVLLMSSFVLMALGGERAQLEGGVKYVALNLFSSAMFLTGLGLLYGLAGTLNIAELALVVRAPDAPALLTPIAMLFFIAFGIKAAAFPLFFWLPASYHTPPPAIGAVFAGLLTKVGAYALARFFLMIYPVDPGLTRPLFFWTAALTMAAGVLGAIVQRDLRRALAFQLVSHIGYILMGVAIGSPLAVAGAAFYFMHHIVVMTNLFLIAGVIKRLRATSDLDRLGGLYTSAPLLAFLFVVPAMSLAGVPPLSGFFGKLALVRAAIEDGAWGLVAAALAVGLLTLYAMARIWSDAFWRPAPEAPAEPPRPLSAMERLSLYAPIMALAAITIGIGLGAGPLFDLSERAATQLLDPVEYIDAVLGDAR